MGRKETKPSGIKVSLKVCFAVFLAFGWLVMVYLLIGEAIEEGTDYYNTDAYYLNQCEEYYLEKQYSELFDHMNLHKNYDEMYDVYWEVVDAYLDLQECLKWKQVSETDISDAREMEKYYYDKVIAASKKCRFPQNQKYLDDFVERIQ